MSLDLAIWHTDEVVHELILLEVAVCTTELEVRHLATF